MALTAETCPHYLTFSASEIADGATEFKCAPPIREAEHRDRLWAALGDGTLDFIASDHSPCPPEMKRKDTGDFFAAWGGIASLELALAAVWTSARLARLSCGPSRRVVCRGPARLAGLSQRKGSIAPGRDADLVIWNPEARSAWSRTSCTSGIKQTPYAGRDFHGVVTATFLRGRKIFERGEFPAGPIGSILNGQTHERLSKVSESGFRAARRPRNRRER